MRRLIDAVIGGDDEKPGTGVKSPAEETRETQHRRRNRLLTLRRLMPARKSKSTPASSKIENSTTRRPSSRAVVVVMTPMKADSGVGDFADRASARRGDGDGQRETGKNRRPFPGPHRRLDAEASGLCAVRPRLEKLTRAVDISLSGLRKPDHAEIGVYPRQAARENASVASSKRQASMLVTYLGIALATSEAGK